MALLACDGFDYYATASFGLAWPGYTWQQPGSVAITGTGARFGGGCMQVSYMHLWLPFAQSPKTTLIAGFAFKRNAYTATTSKPIAFYDDVGEQVSFRFDGSYRIQAYVNGTAIAGAVTTTTITNDVWYYLEAKVKVDASSGTVELRINGTTEINVSGYNTKGQTSTNITRLYMYNGSDNAYQYYDDLYIEDANFLGDVRVQSVLPSGAGGTTQWSPSAGSNYQCVDEAAHNSDTDYVSETTAGEKDTYAFQNVTPTTGTVKAVKVVLVARKDDAGSRSIAPVYGNGTPASDVDGATVSIGTSYAFYPEITEVNPLTSSAWTISDVNGAEFGVKLVS
jgi:hypothetical protein